MLQGKIKKYILKEKELDTIYSFPPIVDKNSKILILGSMPGVESLKKQQYYGHPQNHFWKIIYKLFDKELEMDYEARVQFLKDNGIALWDVLESCKREGSLDSDIIDEKVNPINELLYEYPNINRIFLNGGKAYSTFKKAWGHELANYKFIKLPSTSPANTMKFEKKLLEWSIIREASLEYDKDNL